MTQRFELIQKGATGPYQVLLNGEDISSMVRSVQIESPGGHSESFVTLKLVHGLVKADLPFAVVTVDEPLSP